MLVLLSVLGFSSQAKAQPQQFFAPFDVRLAVDLPLIGAAGAVALGSELAKRELPGPACGPLCDPQSVNGLDRTVIGNRSPAGRTASDVLLGLHTALPFAIDLIDILASRSPGGLRGYGQDVLVLAEVLLINTAVNNLFKFAVRRPRPLSYDPEVDLEDRTDPDAALSFYSGHSSTAFAMATAYSYLFMLRHPGSKLIVPVWVLSESMAATIAYLRVHAGLHFYTDVLAGAVVGSALGLLIPYLHRRVMPAALARRGRGSAQAAQGLRFSVAPTVLSGGAGLVLSVY